MWVPNYGNFSTDSSYLMLGEEDISVIDIINNPMTGNPATIMNDPDLADATHVELITPDYVTAFSVPCHPEASPGPQDSTYLFDTFVALLGSEHD